MQTPDTLARYFRIRTEDIAYFKFILESYEGVGVLSTLDNRAAIVGIRVAPDFNSLFNDLLQDLGREMDIAELDPDVVDLPDDWYNITQT